MQHCNLHCISLAVSSLQWISKNQNYWIATEKHLWDITILVHWLRLFLSFSCLRHFRPHFLHVLENHVAMSTSKISRVKRKPQLLLLTHCNLFYVNHLKKYHIYECTNIWLGWPNSAMFLLSNPAKFSSGWMANVTSNQTIQLESINWQVIVIFQQAQCCWFWSY